MFVQIDGEFLQARAHVSHFYILVYNTNSGTEKFNK